jgi:hypothetical protein
VQTQILAQYPSGQLSVYAVWLPMLWGDAREEWDGTSMPDARVMHFWDGDLQVGGWFAREVDGYDGIAWDVYYLYGPDATWESVPSPLVGSGATIFGEHETLRTEVDTLLDK